MDRKQILQVLAPAGAVALVVILIAALIMTSSWDDGKTKDSAPKKVTASGPTVPVNDEGMTNTVPPVDAPEWTYGPQGVKIWDVKEGEGEPCKDGATVLIHYSGWLTNGTLFDSSRKELKPDKSGEPVSFPLADLVKGWQVGIPGMKPGGIRRLLIPSDLGYGPRGKPPIIPGGATLVFEIKLFSAN